MNKCIFESCTLPGVKRGYCESHYSQWKRGSVLKPIQKRDMGQYEHCTELGCSHPVKSKGLCQMHYARLLRHGHTKYIDRKKEPKICSIENCGNWLYAKGLCHKHYIKDRHHKVNFSFKPGDYQKMLDAQGGGCAICGGQERIIDPRTETLRALPVDHDHVTGNVRGILCSHHNRAIGLFGDDPAMLRKAADYLERHALSLKTTDS